MLYILDQRLRAQNILKDKASKGGSMDVVHEDCSWVGVGIAWGGSMEGVAAGLGWRRGIHGNLYHSQAFQTSSF